MNKESEIKGYCNYCKSSITKNESFIIDKNGKIFHDFCYVQMNTYTDDFGTYTTDKYGVVTNE